MPERIKQVKVIFKKNYVHPWTLPLALKVDFHGHKE